MYNISDPNTLELFREDYRRINLEPRGPLQPLTVSSGDYYDEQRQLNVTAANISVITNSWGFNVLGGDRAYVESVCLENANAVRHVRLADWELVPANEEAVLKVSEAARMADLKLTIEN